MNRRGFLFGAPALLAAPAIVRVASIMPVSVPRLADLMYGNDEFVFRTSIPNPAYGNSPAVAAIESIRQFQEAYQQWLCDLLPYDASFDPVQAVIGWARP